MPRKNCSAEINPTWETGSGEREALEARVDQMAVFLQEHEGRKLTLGKPFRKYFDLIYYHEGQPDEKFMYGRERYDVIDEDIRLCGYFVIITSEKMTAEDALDLYKSRDASEKLFRGDKSYLGNRASGYSPMSHCMPRSLSSL